MIALAASTWVLRRCHFCPATDPEEAFPLLPGEAREENVGAFSSNGSLAGGLVACDLWESGFWESGLWGLSSPLSPTLARRLSGAGKALWFERLGLPPFKPFLRAARALRASEIMRLE